MGQQIIMQPDGKLAIFSSVVDTWVVSDATPDDIVLYFSELGRADAERNARRQVEAVLDGRARDVYYQFAMTFEEADQRSQDQTGKRLADLQAEFSDLTQDDLVGLAHQSADGVEINDDEWCTHAAPVTPYPGHPGPCQSCGRLVKPPEEPS